MMVHQQTLKSSFTLEGTGLHTGASIQIRFNPAPANSGYRIRRTDLPGQPVIRALAEYVTDTTRATELTDRGASVKTVEHALAALYGCGVDNCLIDVNGPELPILDGSALPYVEQLYKVGLQPQKAARRYFQPQETIKVHDENTLATLSIVPADHFSVACRISYNSPLLKEQVASLDILDDFVRQIAGSRTFVFLREIAPLLDRNLIKGGSLQNAIVIYDKPIEQETLDKLADMMGVKRRSAKNLGYIIQRGMTFYNEPARHKILDLLGDLALTGYFIKGRVIAHFPGHTINNQLARAVRREIDITSLPMLSGAEEYMFYPFFT
ncbi:MAG: UDP-3-O-acyl-N-acetylglucosamine deacetylase [Tannerellaceae bacterium]|nr:UDP-3-O-acyl-N-acetylglucosamine deacetylase [Tannerellaceae bacterium]